MLRQAEIKLNVDKLDMDAIVVDCLCFIGVELLIAIKLKQLDLKRSNLLQVILMQSSMLEIYHS